MQCASWEHALKHLRAPHSVLSGPANEAVAQGIPCCSERPSPPGPPRCPYARGQGEAGVAGETLSAQGGEGGLPAGGGRHPPSGDEEAVRKGEAGDPEAQHCHIKLKELQSLRI